MTTRGDSNGNKYDRASELTDTDIRELLTELDTRFRPVVDQIEFNRKHFHNLPAADPIISAPYEKCQKYQSDAPRRVHVKLRSRLLENGVQAQVANPRGIATMERAANDLGIVLNAIIEFVNDRQNTNLQGALASHLTIDMYGVLHWGRAADIWPEVPEREYLDVLPQGDLSNYEPNTSYAGGDAAKRGRKYREKMTAYKGRIARDQACAGVPYYIEAIDPATFRYVEDRSLANGFGICVVSRKVGRLNYVQRLRAERANADDIVLSMNQANDAVPVYGERNAPSDYLPSSAGWGATVTVHQIWTRTEVYEVVTPDSGQAEGAGFQCVKSDKHLWKMPPFALAPATVTESSAPALKYEPALQGIYRIKPMFDRLITLYGLMAENIALPLFYYRRIDNGKAYLAEDGKATQYLSRDQAMAGEAPPGTELATIDFQMNPAFQAFVEWLGTELRGAEPSTGSAEVSASTQPWAIRLQQAMESVEPGMYLSNIANAFQVCLRSIAGDMSLKPEDGGLRAPVAVFGRTKDGEVDYSEVVSVEPEDIKTLDIAVKADNTSAAERVTLIQLGLQLLTAQVAGKPVGVIDLEEFYRDYMGKPNPFDAAMTKRASDVAEQYITPAIQRKALAKLAGTMMVMGPNGELVGLGGESLSSQQVLQQAAAGGNQDAARDLAMSQAGGQMAGQQTPVASPPLADLAVPGAIPLQGRPA